MSSMASFDLPDSDRKEKKTCSKARLVFIVVSLAVIAVAGVIGYSIGKQNGEVAESDKNKNGGGGETGKQTNKEKEEKEEKMAKDRMKEIIDNIKAPNIDNNLRMLTYQNPHPGGMQRNSFDLVAGIKKNWTDQGMDEVTVDKYRALLSYPNNPGRISFINSTGASDTLVIGNEPVVNPSETSDDVLFPFNAFSPKKIVTGELVFVNYGRGSDFDEVANMNLTVKGKICLMKYTHGARSTKVYTATQRGCLGAIIYSDLKDYTIPGQEYPTGWMLNKDGIQRGTINQVPGEALSVGYPNKEGYWQLPLEKEKGLPTIPSQPISFAQAKVILDNMNDTSVHVPDEWIGRYSKQTYKMQSGKGVNFTLNVDTRKETKEIQTVCGTVYGREEKDRYIMVGNHRDSWTFGAADPSSGTSCLLEMVRAIGSVVKKTGWRPRRSIKFCSWDTEEPGYQGSTEWTDDYHKFIMNQVVAYLNVDMAVEGNFTLRIKSLEHIEDSLFSAAKQLKTPHTKNNLYEDWLDKSKMLLRAKNKDDAITKPTIFTPSAGSDYKPFWWTYGTTIVDYRYLFSKVEYPFLGANGHYHTRYESYDWMTGYVDPGMVVHETLAQFWTQHALMLADEQRINFDLVKYANQIEVWFNKLEKDYLTSYLQPQNITLAHVRESLDKLKCEAKTFMTIAKIKFAAEKTTVLEKRAINDKIMNFERNFLIQGLTKNEATRHSIWCSAKNYLSKTSNKFPGLQEAIYEAEKNKGDWDKVRKHATLIKWCLDTATKSLQVK